MKKMILILAFLTIVSCNNDDDNQENEVYDGVNIDTAVEFSLFDSEGNDLLNPESPNAISQEGIKLFYVVDGNEKEFYKANLDYPKNYLVFEQEGTYRVRLFANDAENEDRPIAYIQWTEKRQEYFGGRLR